MKYLHQTFFYLNQTLLESIKAFDHYDYGIQKKIALKNKSPKDFTNGKKQQCE